MSGIAFCGSYVPAFRMDRGTIAGMWQRSSVGGERSVANNDEDSITMSAEASMNCLRGIERKKIEGLFFATTTAPYQEKMNSALIATAIDLTREISTADFSNSLRAGTGALKAAFDIVEGGSLKNILVTAADCRLGYPISDEEQTFGDGAAALLVAKENIVATFEGSYSICNEMMDVWRKPDDTFVRTWESRFIMEEGYQNHMREVIAGILRKYNLRTRDISKAILPAPNARAHRSLVGELGFDAEQIQDPLLFNVGYCGTAQPLLMLVGALEESSPGDVLLLASYADGADAMIFKVTEEIARKRSQRKLRDYIDQKLILSSYARFLSYKGLLKTVPGEPFRLFPSATVTWRDRDSVIRCHGSRCLSCGVVTYPIQRVCYNCGSKDNFEEVRISDLQGEVFTFSLDRLAGRSDDPVVIQTVAELGKDKIRFYGMMTDSVPSEVSVGMTVGLTFRRIYDDGGMHNYFWKCKPVNHGEDK